MADGEFDARLRVDLQRGHAQQPKSAGRAKPLFARWLTAAEMTGKQWQHKDSLLLGLHCCWKKKTRHTINVIARRRPGSGLVSAAGQPLDVPNGLDRRVPRRTSRA